ncbi:MAG: alpha/beta hydrolase [Tissierellia bacterium]|nr:alpha/beta hydrolase [Tissierellia bacterium]
MKEMMLSADNKELYYRYWPAPKEEKVLQIVHGASEHSGRYHEFAQWMNEKGVSVYALDNRGHGMNSLAQGYVHIDNLQWKRLPEDVLQLGDLIKERTNKTPYLLGHSMGSFIARIVASSGGDYQRFFFTGTGWEPRVKLEMSLALTDGLIALHGVHYQDPIMERLSFEMYRREMIKKGYTTSSFGWLTRDADKLKEAEAEMALKERFSLGAFKTLLLLVRAAQDTRCLPNIKAPIHFLSGEHDPVGEFTKAVDKAYHSYKKAPVEVYRHIYSGMHHEILNELGREEVYKDIYYFMQL